MLDTLEMTRTLTDTGLKPDQAAAVIHMAQQAAEHGNHVPPEQFQAGVADLRAAIGRSGSRTIKWVAGIVLTTAGIVTAGGVAVGLALLRALNTLAALTAG